MEDITKIKSVTIDGVEYSVTLTPIPAVETPIPKEKKDIFDVERSGEYYYIAKNIGKFDSYEGCNVFDWDSETLENGLGASDKEYVERLADAFSLHCLLKKYAEQNNKTYTVLSKDKGNKYLIVFNGVCFTTGFISNATTSPLEVYFSDQETARKALMLVVKPFMKEHPEFEKYIKGEK